MPERFAFEWALQQIRQGKKVRRSGWNGKGMFLVYQKGYPDGIPINENTSEATGLPRGMVCRFLPYIMIKVQCEQGPTFAPWTASNSDILAFDWEYAD